MNLTEPSSIISNEGIPPVSKIDVAEDKKVDILVQYWMSLRERITTWESRTYNVTVWTLGLVFSAVGYLLVQPQTVNLSRKILISIAFCILGILTQAFFHVARKSYRMTGEAIERVQSALRLCEPDQYLAHEPFFGYSGRYLPPKIITVLQVFNFFGLLLALMVVLFVV